MILFILLLLVVVFSVFTIGFYSGIRHVIKQEPQQGEELRRFMIRRESWRMF